MPSQNYGMYEFIQMLPPPRGKHRYASHQDLIEDIHNFLCKIPTEASNKVEEAGVGGTTWLELFRILEHMGFSTEHTAEHNVAAVKAENLSAMLCERQSKWIAHRLQHRAGAKAGLKKPLATAEARRDLNAELNTFMRVTRYIVKHSGSQQARECFQVKEDGYQNRLAYLAIAGSQPTISLNVQIPDTIAQKVAAAISMHRTGQTSKANTMYKCYQKEVNEGVQTCHKVAKAELTLRGPPRWRQEKQWPPDAHKQTIAAPIVDRIRRKMPLINWVTKVRKILAERVAANLEDTTMGSCIDVPQPQPQPQPQQQSPQSPRGSSAISGHMAMDDPQWLSKEEDMTVAKEQTNETEPQDNPNKSHWQTEDVKGVSTPSDETPVSERERAWAVHLGRVQGAHSEGMNTPKVAVGGYLSGDPQGGTARSDAFLVLQLPLMLKRETAGEPNGEASGALDLLVSPYQKKQRIEDVPSIPHEIEQKPKQVA